MSGETLRDIIKDAIEELSDRIEDEDGEPGDIISEIADSSVPVYTSDLLNLASGNNSLATNVPELGPAFDGEPTPVNIIAANIYEAVEAALWERWNEIKKEA